MLLVFEVRACRISKAVSAALIALLKEPLQVPRIPSGDTEFDAHSSMDILSESFGSLDPQAVEIQVLLVFSSLVPLSGNLTRTMPDGDERTSYDVRHTGGDRPPQGDATSGSAEPKPAGASGSGSR